MATSGRATDAYPGRPHCYLELNVSLHSTSGNSTRWNWSLYAKGSSSWSLDDKPWAVNVEGDTWSGSRGLDFRSTSSILLGSGTTGWVAHNADGYNTVTYSAYHNMGGIFGNASASGSFAANRIPKVPDAPSPIGIDQVTADSLRYRFSGNDNGGSAIKSWQIQIATNSSFTAGVRNITSGGTTTIDDLANHTKYWVRSRGQNSVGWGPYSSALSDSTLGHPTVPRSVVATPSPSVSGRISISWTAPATTGEGGIVGYNIFRGGTQIATTTGTGTGYTDNNRTPYTSYSYTVAARNAYSTSVSGIGPKSSAASAVAPGPPSAPRNLTGQSSGSTPGQVILSWTAPVNIGAGGITGYNVRLADGTLIQKTTGTATTYTVNDLSPGVAYTFKVSARNALADAEDSESDFSSQVIVTPVGEPNAPTGVVVSASSTASNRLVISWSAPGGSLSGYNIFQRVNGADTLIGTVNSSHTSFTDDGVPSGANRTYVVRARTIYTDTLAPGYPGSWGGPASNPATFTATSNSSQIVSSLSAVSSATNAVFNGTYTVSQVTATTIRYARASDNIPATVSGGTITNNTNVSLNGTYTISTPTPVTITYSKTGPNIPERVSSGGVVTNNTNVSLSGTFTVTSVNAGANLISYSSTGSNVSAVSVPKNPAPGMSSTLKNLSNVIFNGAGFVITATTSNTLSFNKTNANVAESNAAGTVTNVTNRDLFNGTYTVGTVDAYNILSYPRTAEDMSVRTWYAPNGLVARTTSPSTLDIKFRSGWAG